MSVNNRGFEPRISSERLRAITDASRKEYAGLASKIVELGKRNNAAALFTVVSSILSMGPAGQALEVTHGTGPAKTEHLAYHLWPLFEGSEQRRFPPASDIQQCLDILEDAISSYLIAFAEINQQENREESLLSSAMRMNAAVVRGSAFPEQTTEEILGVQGRYANWLEHRCGIAPGVAIDAIWAIVRAHEKAANAVHNLCRARGDALGSQWLQARKRKAEKRTAEEEQLVVAFSTFKDAQIAGFIDGYEQAIVDSLPVSLVQIREAVPAFSNAHLNALVNLVGLTEPARREMSEPQQVSHRPVYVLPSGKLLAFCVSSAMDALWAAFESIAASDRTFYDEKYAPTKGKWLEEKVADCLARVFPNEAIATGLRYPDPDNPGGEAELDCLVEWGPFVVVCEMKSVNLHQASLLGRIKPLTSDVRKAIGKPFQQALRARHYIEQSKQARFRTSNGTTRILTRDQLSRIYCVTISQHHLSGLSADLRMLDCLHGKKISAYPYSVCLADLDVITRFCEVPEVFLHYLVKRLELTHTGPRVNADEQDIFMAYLASRLLPENLNLPDFSNNKVRGLSFVGWRGEVDVYFQWLRGEAKTKPSIGLKVPEEIRLLLRMLRDRKDPAARWIAVSLLGLPNQTMAAISGFMMNLVSQPLSNDVFRTQGLQVGDTTICLCGCTKALAEEIKDRIIVRTNLEKYRRQTLKAMGVSFLTDGHTNLMLHTVLWLEGPWEFNQEMEDLSSSIRFAVAPGTAMPPRNDLCCCGSGKKFKKCCLRWLERGRQA